MTAEVRAGITCGIGYSAAMSDFGPASRAARPNWSLAGTRPEEGATHTISHSPKIIYFMLYRLNILYLCEFFRSVCVHCEIFAR